MSLKEFDEVIGYEDAKVELERIADMITNKDKYLKLGVNLTRGVLIYGVPGLGKTLLANCFIKACKIPSFVLRKDKPNGDFVKEIVDVFNKAKEKTPSIVLLDDLDKFSNNDVEHINSEELITVQSCIDSCEDTDVFVIATANDTTYLPNSLIRAGRIDKEIPLSRPSSEDSKKIIRYYLSKINYVNASSDFICDLLSGCTCAQTATIINEAGVYAAFENKNIIDDEDIIRSYLRHEYEAPEQLNKEENKALIKEIAYHEAGHALVSEMLLKNSIKLITIKKHKDSHARAFAGFNPSILDMNDYDMYEKIVIAFLGGKAATEIVFGKIDIGSHSDIYNAYRKVSDFITWNGSLGFNGIETEATTTILKHKQEMMINQELEKYYQKAKRIIANNREKLDKLANALMDKEVLFAKDIASIVN